jgi:hypothetical protein
MAIGELPAPQNLPPNRFFHPRLHADLVQLHL